MSSFKKEAKQNLFNLIVLHIFQCCEKMRNDCRIACEKLDNREDIISNRLVERYLDLNFLELRFIRETPEHYESETDTYKGRTDIKVVSSDWMKNPNAYFIIECKRIDGGNHLNKEYISEGIARFLIPSPNPKYSSYYGRSIMLGYIVKAKNVGENMKKIDNLQRTLLAEVTIGDMSLVCDNGEGFSRYQCSYQANATISVELTHLFYDFSDVVCANE
jgi:hypothetical protein